MMKYKTGETHMDVGAINRTLLIYAAPIFLSQLLQQFYYIADCAVIGRFCDAFALAAVGVAGLVLAVHINFFIGFSVGISSAVSRLFGARRYDELRRVVFTAAWLSGLIGICFTALGETLGETWLTWLGCPAETAEDASAYLFISLLGLAPQLVYNTANAILRALGSVKKPLYDLALASALNLALDLIFVAGLDLGLMGAALATLAAAWALGFASLWRLTCLDPRFALSTSAGLLTRKE